MNKNKPLIVNHFDSQSRSQLLSHEPLLSTQDLALKGTKFDYYHYNACETPIHINEHHIICLAISKTIQERELDGVDQQEINNVGSVSIIPAQVEHWTFWKAPLEFAIFSIQSDVLAMAAAELIGSNKIELIPTFAKPEPDYLISGIGMAIKQVLESDPGGNSNSLYLDHLTNTLLIHLLRNYATKQPKPQAYEGGLTPYRLQQATDYIHAYLDVNLRVSQLSQVVGISEYHFSRQFKKSTGLTPHQYITRQRIDKVKQLLKNTKLPIAEISSDCGFTHQSHMGRVFKEHIGSTPKKYRDELSKF
jgi:AraC family transcriptional regulator